MAALLAPGVAAARDAAYSYDVPVEARSPWPEMRRAARNTAASPIRARYHGDRPWSFTTARGIFSTPVIGGDGTIYVGSADRYFYALRPDSRLARRSG
jgi:outer membrane protein assembly factor BamB